MNNQQVYSYHTFLYPFLWDNGGAVTIDVFRKMLREGWEPNDMIQDGKLISVENPKAWLKDSARTEEQRLDYQAFQYFNASARKALFGADGDIVHNFTYCPAEIHEKAKYRIYAYHRYWPERTAPYELNVNDIRLKLFNTGVGILAFELEYPMPEGGCKAARQDVRAINEFGRRIYPEFLPKCEKGFGDFSDNLCGPKIELQIGGMCLTETIRERAEAHLGVSENIPAQSYLRDPLQKNNFIRRLLFREDSDAQIIPAVDDRMFVCCCIADPDYTEHFMYPPIPEEADAPTDETEKAAWEEAEKKRKRREKNLRMQEHQWNFLTDWETGDELYALTNIDLMDGSCQNRAMLNHYFEEQLYLRWAEMGYCTIHSVTNHSIMCLTGNPIFVQDTVINPFLILYVQMAILVLAQRASLISFDAKITNCVSAAQSDKTEIGGQMLRELIDLSEAFAVFQGEILIQEVTSQIQGIEVYEKLQKMLFVDRLEANIQRQMRNLFEIAQSRQAQAQREHDEEMKRLAKQQEEKQRELREEEMKKQKKLEEKQAELDKKQEEKQQRFDNALAILGVGFTFIALFSAFIDLHDFIGTFYGKDATPWLSGITVAIVLVVVYVAIKNARRLTDWLVNRFLKKKE